MPLTNKIESMKKKMIISFIVVATVMSFIGSSYSNNNTNDLLLDNIEALANGELSNGNCEGSWSQECCKCDYIHYTYACAIEVTGNSCYTVSGCSHYTN